MSPRNKIQLEEIRVASRDKIIKAALQLFGTRGYGATSMRHIAEEADVSKGLLYHYFKSKEDLLQQMTEDLTRMEEQALGQIYAEDPRLLMRNLLERFFREMQENFEQWRLIMNLSMQVERFDFIHELAIAKMQGYLQLFEEILDRLGWDNPREEARILAGVLDGIGVQFLVLKEDYHLPDMESILINKYCK